MGFVTLDYVKIYKLDNNCSGVLSEGISLGDDHFVHSRLNGIEGILYLGNHTAGNRSVGDITIEVVASDNRDDTIVVIRIRQDTLFLKTESESDIIIRSKRAFAVSAAMVSALVLRILPCPSWVSGAMTGVMPASMRVYSIRPSALSTSPTKP